MGLGVLNLATLIAFTGLTTRVFQQNMPTETLNSFDGICWMLRIFLNILGSILVVLPLVARASGESCTVEGNTSRWAMSYCMTRFETDDEAHPGVSACFNRELTQKVAGVPAEDCDSNLAYKSAMCSILIEFGTYEQSLASCIESDEMIPSVVTHGIG